MQPVTILHVSDLHFGRPAVPAQLDAVARMIQERRYDVVAFSGDLTQRARAKEFRPARAFIAAAREVSQVIVVPGNHDVTWWRSPLQLFGHTPMLTKYRRNLEDECEPVLRLPGVTLVGLNSCHGISVRTLTTRPRDLSILGDLVPAQLERARRIFLDSPPGDVRVVVVHHNVTRGQLSRRLGLRYTDPVLDAFAEMNVDAVLCGHDHQEAVEPVERRGRRMLVSTAGTISDRSRGARPSSVTELSVSGAAITARICLWSTAGRFVHGPEYTFTRT